MDLVKVGLPHRDSSTEIVKLHFLVAAGAYAVSFYQLTQKLQ